MNGRVDAVLLDMGGILIPEIPELRAGREPDYSGAAAQPDILESFRALGVEDPERVLLGATTSVLAAYRAAEPHEAFDPEDLLGDHPADVRGAILRALVRVVDRPPFSHAREVVASLSRRYRLGLVSNNIFPGDHHARTLARFGILEHLQSYVWSANFGPRKPDPSMLRHVLDEMRVPPERAVFVGDKIRTDVYAARRAGVRSIWLRRADAPVPTDGVRPDAIIHDLRELPILLRGRC